MDLPTLALTCFGPPTARVAGGQPSPDVLWRKHLALLTYLALSPDRTRSREHLIGLLWPEKTQERARHSLNEAIRRLRSSLGAGRLLSRGEAIQLSDAGLEVDAQRFEQVAARNPSEAARLVGGDFLEGFTVDDAPAFEDWAAAQRIRLRSICTSALLAAGESALAANRFTDAQAAAQRALTLHPSSEAAANLLMRSLSLAGDAAGALAAFHEFRERLAGEIGEEPGKELDALAERVRTRRWRRASSKYAELEPPLLGRQDAHRAAFALLETALKSGAQCLVVTGDPGMGKTRLLDECVDRIALMGAVVAEARPLESDHDAPWSTLRHLARSGLTGAPGAAAADPRALSVLAALIPELGQRFGATEPRDVGDVAQALASLLRAVADEQPLGVAVDDAQFADGASIGALRAAMSQLGSSHLVLVLAVDVSAENQPRALLRLRGDVGRSIAGRTVLLEPLTLEEMRELAAAVAAWCETPQDLDRLARRLTHEAGGSPFLAVTLLRDLDRTSTLQEDLLRWPDPAATLESPLPFSIPDLARLAIVARVAELDPECHRVLGAASMLGMALDPPLISALAELSTERVEALLDTLEQRRFVTFDGNRYAFTGALLMQVVRGECLTPGQRQRLRKRAIVELLSRDDLESKVLRAELMAKVDPGDTSFDAAIAVARVALDQRSDRTARRALFAAERAARRSDGGKRSVVERLRAKLES